MRTNARATVRRARGAGYASQPLAQPSVQPLAQPPVRPVQPPAMRAQAPGAVPIWAPSMWPALIFIGVGMYVLLALILSSVRSGAGGP